MNDTILVAVIVSIISPSLLGFITYLLARQTKKQEWARQDIVAARVAEATAIAKKTGRTAEKTHKLVNAQHDALLERISQLIRALNLADIDVPENGNAVIHSRSDTPPE